MYKRISKYLNEESPLSWIVYSYYDAFLKYITPFIPYIDRAVKEKILIRKLLETHDPRSLKWLKRMYKIARPWLREDWGDEITATAIAHFLFDVKGDEIRQKVDEKSLAKWILLQLQDLKLYFNGCEDGIYTKVKEDNNDGRNKG